MAWGKASIVKTSPVKRRTDKIGQLRLRKARLHPGIIEIGPRPVSPRLNAPANAPEVSFLDTAAVALNFVYSHRSHVASSCDGVFERTKPSKMTLGEFFRMSIPRNAPEECAVVALLYFDRIEKSQTAIDRGLAPLPQTSMHLAMLAAVVLAMKYWDDDVGRVGRQCRALMHAAGAPQAKLWDLERELLTSIDYRLGFTAGDLTAIKSGAKAAAAAARASHIPDADGTVTPPARSPRTPRRTIKCP